MASEGVARNVDMTQTCMVEQAESLQRFVITATEIGRSWVHANMHAD